MLADIPIDPLHPWITLLVQAGSLGLLAWVVIVIYPASAKQAREEREARDSSFERMLNVLQTRHDARSDEVVRSQGEIAKQQNGIVKAIVLQTSTLKTAIDVGLDRIESSVTQVCKHKLP